MAIPALRSTAASAAISAEHRHILRGCRLYVAQVPTSSADAACMLDGLRCLKRCVDQWALTRFGCAARFAAEAAPGSPPLGTAARLLVAWLREHPDQADEPLQWLVSEMCDAWWCGAASRYQGDPETVPIGTDSCGGSGGSPRLSK
jgi:hypothetical protein